MSTPEQEHMGKLLAWVLACPDHGLSPAETAAALGGAVGFLVNTVARSSLSFAVKKALVVQFVNAMMSGVTDVADCVVIRNQFSVVEDPDEEVVH